MAVLFQNNVNLIHWQSPLLTALILLRRFVSVEPIKQTIKENRDIKVKKKIQKISA